MGGNRSWQGLRRWYIPVTSVEAESQLHLGGPKYAEYEVEPGDPLPARTTAQAVASS
jgi:hypothetical protein